MQRRDEIVDAAVQDRDDGDPDGMRLAADVDGGRHGSAPAFRPAPLQSLMTDSILADGSSRQAGGIPMTDWVSGASLVVSGASFMVAWSGYMLSRRNALASAENEIARRWAMEARLHPPGLVLAIIEYDREGPAIDVASIEGVFPDGIRLQGCALQADGQVVLDDEGPRDVVRLKGWNGQAGARSIFVIVHMPPKPSWSLTPTTRIRVEVRYEARDARRRSTNVGVMSPEIPWEPPAVIEPPAGIETS